MQHKLSITELEARASLYEMICDIPKTFRFYIRLAISLCKQGDMYYIEKDYERAYIAYLKFTRFFIDEVTKFSELDNKENDDIRKHLKKNSLNAINILEELKPILTREYEEYLKWINLRKIDDLLVGQQNKLNELNLIKNDINRSKGNSEFVYNPNWNVYDELNDLPSSNKHNNSNNNYLKAKDYYGSNRVSYPNINYNRTDQYQPTRFDNNNNNNLYNQQLPPKLLPKPMEFLFKENNNNNNEEEYINKKREINIPTTLISKFLNKVKNNTINKIETCGILCGKLNNNKLIITTLIIPQQYGTSDTCTATNEEQILNYQINNDLLTLGWIHTHPTQTCFLSSLDLHTQCGYQLLLSEAIAIVCSTKEDKVGVFRLSDPPGLQYIASCKRREAFHEHLDMEQYKIYYQVEDRLNWLSEEDCFGLSLVDFRL